jgi:serine/threonine-protein kinase RsbW
MTSLERTFSLKVPSATENLALIRDFVANVGNQAGLGDDDVAKLELAVDEACANVMEHAHGYDSNKEVTIRATFDAIKKLIHR